MRVAIKGRPERTAAALLLIALVATLSLLAHPSGKASATATPVDLGATLRYGCATATSDAFVEVSLLPGAHTIDPASPQIVQVGLADSTPANGSLVFPSGGPNLVSLDSGPITVRLAGPPAAGDHVFLRQVGRTDLITLPLPASCRHLEMTDFGLSDPDVVVSRPGCAGSQASLKVTVTNPNEIGDQLQQLGVEVLDYTVLLVRSDGLLAGSEPAGQLVSFDRPGSRSVTVNQVAALPASYQVRVISPDGVVDTVGNKRLSCDSVGHPGPSNSVTATPVRPTPSNTPTVSATAPSTAPTSGSHASSSRPVTSSTATHSAPVSHPVRPSASPTPSTNPSGSSGSSGSSGGFVSSGPVLGTADSTSHAALPKPVKPSVKPTAQASKPKQTIAEAPTRLMSAFRLDGLFSGPAMLIVLIFAVAMAGLLGNSVINARRR